MEDSDPKFQRKRVKHVVPLGSIFVWTIETTILSGMFLTATLFISWQASDSKLNIIDSSISFSLIGGCLITIFSHLVIANAFHRSSMADLAGGLHAGFSNALCSMGFISFVLYVILYVDGCLLQMPTKDICSLLFRNTPFSDIVLGAFSAFLLVIFMATMALSFVSSPQDYPSYVFISKGNLLISSTLLGWISPVSFSSWGRKGCPSQSTQLMGVDPIYIMGSFMGVSVLMGLCQLITEWAAGNIYDPAIKTAGLITHLIFDILTFLVSGAISIPLLFGRNDIGNVGMIASLVVSGIVCLWCAIDFTMALVFMTCWRRSVSVVPTAIPMIPMDPQYQPPQPQYLPPFNPEVAPQPYPYPPQPSQYIDPNQTMTIPPPMTMYMSMGAVDGKVKKKADSLPPVSKTMDDGTMTPLFIQDEVRRSLRQRAPPLVL